MNFCSDGRPSHFACAPLARITASAVTVRPLSHPAVKGRFDRSSEVTMSQMISVPIASEWACIRSIRSGP